jgi:hypothetical protein
MLFAKIPHFLDENGELAADLAGPGRKLAEFLCSIVQSVTSHSFEVLVRTGVRCRRRPKRKPCRGEIAAFLNGETKNIEWVCPECGDAGHISDWEKTHWDMTSSDVLAVRLHVSERDLILRETLAEPYLTDRLEAAKQVGEVVVVYFLPDELDSLIDHIAATANHCEHKTVQDELDFLYDGLSAILDIYLDQKPDPGGGVYH